MGKFVIDGSVVLYLLSKGIEVTSAHQLVAPTLLRSEVLEALFTAVRNGELPEEAGLDRLARFATMKIRFLGDKVLRRQAWAVAKRLGLNSTSRAEYIALTQLQADAFITLDAGLASSASEIVPTATIEELV